MVLAANFFKLDSPESDTDDERRTTTSKVAERISMKKKKKKTSVEKPDSEANDDGGKKLKKHKKVSGGNDTERSKGNEENRSYEKALVNADDDVSAKTDKRKRKRIDDDDDLGPEVNKPKKKKPDCEASGKKSKKKKKKVSDGDEIGDTGSSKVNKSGEGSPSHANDDDDDAERDKGKRKSVGDNDLGAKGDKAHKPKKKKKKSSVDSDNILSSAIGTRDANQIQTEAEGKLLKNSTKDSKKKKLQQIEDSEFEENNKDSLEDADKTHTELQGDDFNSPDIAKKKKKKQSEDPEAEENNNGKKKRKKKQSEDPEAEENDLNSPKNGKNKNNKGKEKRKKRQKRSSKNDEVVTTPSPSTKSAKKVNFSDHVEVFPAESEESEKEEEDDEQGDVVRGKRFTEEEDELIKKAVLEYVDNHALGEEGVNMVMNCKSHKQLKGCWKEIAAALPWRPYTGVYYRAHTLFEAGSKGVWSKEDLELVVEYQKKHGNDWRTLADAMGKHRNHVKDAWRRIRLASKKKGHWSMEEYQSLFDLVNKDLKMKAFKEKHSKHGMLRDNIPWMAISDQLGTRDHVVCCLKWYDQLTSPMVAKGIWANVDDYRLLDELTNLDAACVDDVDWDNLLDNRDGDACRSRWNQMVNHIGLPGTKTFAEQVEILSQRYCPDLAEDREDFDNRPFDPEDD